jgi:hypothetical protein
MKVIRISNSLILWHNLLLKKYIIYESSKKIK